MSEALKNFVNFSRKIVAVGLNYKVHANELNMPLPITPLLFLKPPSSFIKEGQDIKIPACLKSCHHEVELGFVIGETVSNVSKENAMSYVGGYVLALDMTAREFQGEVFAKSHPWLTLKCWDTFCPVSDLIPTTEVPDPHNLDLWLKVNGELRQSANTSDMVFNLPEIISYASSIMTLERGDLIITGTPYGVGEVKSGDVIKCGIKGVTEMKFNVK